MASVNLITSAGGYSSAQPFKLRSTDCQTFAGVAIATGRVAWGGSDSPLSRVPWLPKAGTPFLVIDGQGRMTNQVSPAWDRALRWLFEEYIGGIQAPTVAALTNSVEQTQQQVVQVQVQASTAQATANSAAESVNTTRQVLVDDGVPGAEQIPPARQSGISDFEP